MEAVPETVEHDRPVVGTVTEAVAELSDGRTVASELPKLLPKVTRRWSNRGNPLAVTSDFLTGELSPVRFRCRKAVARPGLLRVATAEMLSLTGRPLLVC